MFFEIEDVTGTCVETYEFPNDPDHPKAEEWFPHPRGKCVTKSVGFHEGFFLERIKLPRK